MSCQKFAQEFRGEGLGEFIDRERTVAKLAARLGRSPRS